MPLIRPLRVRPFEDPFPRTIYYTAVIRILRTIDEPICARSSQRTKVVANAFQETKLDTYYV